MVLPVYMADGYTLRKGVRDPLKEAFQGGGSNRMGFDRTRVRVLSPLGLHHRIAEIAVDTATTSFARRGISPDHATVLLAAHGTPRNPASRQATELQAQRIAASGRFDNVVVSYLEQDPLITDVLATITSPVAVIGMFASTGMHASVDIEEAIAAFPGLDIDYLGPIGEDDRIADLIADIVSADRTADLALSRETTASTASVMCA
jgi:sirohydrochlorin ferrochelatase